MTEPATLAVWADSLSTSVPCGYGACGRLIVWTTLVESGKRMPFSAPARPQRTERDPATGREIAIMAWDDNHWRTCPGATTMRKPPTRAALTTRERETLRRQQNPTLGFFDDK